MKQNLRGFTGKGSSLLATFTAETALAQTPGSILRLSTLGQLAGPPPVEAREHRYLGWRQVATAATAIAGLAAFPVAAPAAGPAAASALAPVPVLDWQPCPDPSQVGEAKARHSLLGQRSSGGGEGAKCQTRLEILLKSHQGP